MQHLSPAIQRIEFGALPSSPLRLFRVGVIVSKGHRFARKPSIAAADVLAEPLAVFSRKQYALTTSGCVACLELGPKAFDSLKNAIAGLV